jgi:hypothetical protein
MTDTSFWLDRTSAWWAKADRAQNHLRSLDRLVAEFRASEPYAVVPEPTDTPGRTAYRLHIHKPTPPEISTTIGDILHYFNLVLVDDPAHDASNPTSSPPDVVDMLNRWHQYITGWVFGRVFGMISSDGSPT